LTLGSYVGIWHANENERVRISIRMCSDLSIVPIYRPCGVENYIVVSIEDVNEDCEHCKLFCLIPSVRYYELVVGIKVFWPYKYLSMNDEEVATTRDQCHMIMDGVNNLLKK
jgi:hypothetical protein